MKTKISNLTRIIKKNFRNEDFFIELEKILIVSNYKPNNIKYLELTKLLNSIDSENKDKILGYSLEKMVNQKKTGTFYTDYEICYKICEVSIVSFLSDNLTESTKELPDYIDTTTIVKKLKKLKILDPSCGSGAFLISIYDVLNDICLLYDININISSKIYGIDINSEAIKFSKIRMKFHNSLKKKETMKVNLITNDTLSHDFRCRFDVIVGNPPYIELSKIDKKYDGFKFVKSGNIYVLFIEKSFEMLRRNGVVSLIVPISLTSTKRMNGILGEVVKNETDFYFYADRPGCLFTGVHQRIVIFKSIKNNKNKIRTSNYIHWYESEKKISTLFPKLYDNNNLGEQRILKINSIMDSNIFCKVRDLNVNQNIKFDAGDYHIYINGRIGFWMKVFLEDKKLSNEYKKLSFTSEKKMYLYYSIFNSTLFYYIWHILGDGWHILKADLDFFSIPNVTDENYKKIKKLALQLEENLESNKKFINTKQVMYEYKHKYSKEIIDNLDDIICDIYGLNADEKEYIKFYNRKYRYNTEEQ